MDHKSAAQLAKVQALQLFLAETGHTDTVAQLGHEVFSAKQWTLVAQAKNVNPPSTETLDLLVTILRGNAQAAAEGPADPFDGINR